MSDLHAYFGPSPPRDPTGEKLDMAHGALRVAVEALADARMTLVHESMNTDQIDAAIAYAEKALRQ